MARDFPERSLKMKNSLSHTVPARQILVLCFNHNASVNLRKRLNELIGKQARGVTVVTYHGAAMRIAGISVRDVMESDRKNDINFDKIIQDALKLLKGDNSLLGDEQDELRDQLLGGYSHILVDEYQDIDQDQYDLVSAIAGKSLDEGEGRLSIMAVGDDDQNIYAFRGANVQFIRQFEKDYPSKITYLVENYRSSKHIINAANQLIEHNKDRMKGNHPIRIDREREVNKPGGKWSLLDPVTTGRVQVIAVEDPFHQAASVVAEIERLKNLSPDFKWEECAILSRTKKVLSQVRSILEKEKYPIKIAMEKSFPFHRIREIVSFINFLEQQEDKTNRASQILKMYTDVFGNGADNIWTQMLVDFLKNYMDETIDAILPARWLLDQLYEYIAEQRREKMIGNGIFLGTIHSAKGMEFSHVFILDGDWTTPSSRKRWEEERRTLYVAMTRAKETLTLMRSAEGTSPYMKELKGESIFTRKSQVSMEGHHIKNFYNYEILGLDDIFMDYAGRFPKNHSIHKQLAKLKTGTEVFIVNGDRNVQVYDFGKHCISRFSNKAAENWRNRLESIHKVRILSMLTRTRADSDGNFDEWIKTDSWELPILEIVSRM